MTPAKPYILAKSPGMVRDITGKLRADGYNVISYIRYGVNRWKEERTAQPEVSNRHVGGESVMKAAMLVVKLGYNGYHVIDAEQGIDLEREGVPASMIEYAS